MEKNDSAGSPHRRSVGVTVFGWIFVIYAGCNLINFILSLTNPEYVKFISVFPTINLIFRILIMILMLISSIGILKLLPWARKLILYVISIGLTETAIGFYNIFRITPEHVEQLYEPKELSIVQTRAIASIVIAILFIIYLSHSLFLHPPQGEGAV